MNNHYMILVLAAVAAAMSCNKETVNSEIIAGETSPAEQMTLLATAPTIEEDATKAYLNSGNIIWAENDAINVFGDSMQKFVLESGKGTSSGTFTGNKVSGDIYALYPYDEEATCASGIITTTVKSAQTASNSGIANNSNTAVAHLLENGTMTFSNVCGLLKIQIKGDNIGEVEVSGNNGEDLAGKVSISWNNGEPQYTVIEGAKTVSLKPYNDKVFEAGTYYVMVLPQAFSNGITVTMKPYSFPTNAVVIRSNHPQPLVKSGSSLLTVQRSHIKPLGFIDKGLAWNYSDQVSCGGLRGSHTATGCYMDLSTGRTFSPIGSYEYAGQIDMAFITNASNGLAPAAISTVGGYTNDTNLSKFGTNTSADYVANWSVRLAPKFCYVPATELTDEQYEALSTTQDIKAIYTAHEADAVNSYYTPTVNCVTNANRTGDHKFLVVKTYSSTEGTGYGIFRFNAVGGNTWYIQFYYKHGLE